VSFVSLFFFFVALSARLVVRLDYALVSWTDWYVSWMLLISLVLTLGTLREERV